MSGWGIDAWGAGFGGSDGPQIVIVSPAPGVIPGTYAQAVNTPLVFEVTDITPDLQDVIMWASFDGGGNAEMVANGGDFFARYATGSSRTAIGNGYRYTVFRQGGWPADIRLDVRAFDATGNTV